MIITNVFAIVFYLAAALYQGRYLLTENPLKPQRTILLGMGLVATVLHATTVYFAIHKTGGIDLGYFNVGSLFMCFIAVLTLFFTLRRPIDNLLVAVFPLAALSVFISTFNAPASTLNQQLSAGMLCHILASILAYSVLSIALLQAIALGLQDRQLKQRHMTGILRALPPLQTMEAMLFELIWVGLGLLSISIATGFVFIDDIFAQHLAHKTVLSIVAWFIFSALLWGHHQLGWRSHTAVRWTIGGFVALMLSYFGSKLVLEIILQPPL
jgi:ABC-type uncharacterized transport system permease subunit